MFTFRIMIDITKNFTLAAERPNTIFILNLDLGSITKNIDRVAKKDLKLKIILILETLIFLTVLNDIALSM